MKLGIIQGRLTVPKEGHQTTPENWQDEFMLINKLSLNPDKDQFSAVP